MNEVSAEMPRYKCHKEVHALKILKARVSAGQGIELSFVDEGYGDISIEYPEAARFKEMIFGKHGDKTDTGYLVVYEDGYRSWSPTKAFEEGYTRL